MASRLKFSTLTLLILFGLLIPGAAFGDIEAGKEAVGRSDYEAAYEAFLESANKGNAEAQLNLGIMYLLGDGSLPEENVFGAYVMFHFRKDWSGGLGFNFYPGWFEEKIDDLARNGVGVPADYQEALRLFHLSADQGNRYAQYNLAIMYNQGFGTPANYQETLRWYFLAADQGVAKAQTTIGSAYREGFFDLPVDKLEAIRWLHLAAEQSDGEAQTYLGYMYATGEGVPEDDITAYMWYSLGALNGNLNATGTVEYIGETLNPEEIAEVERLTQEWLENHQ